MRAQHTRKGFGRIMSSVIITNRADEDVDFEQDELTDNTDADETDNTEVDRKTRTKKVKGRGFKESSRLDSRYDGRSGKFDSVADEKSHGPNQKCKRISNNIFFEKRS